MGFVEKYGLTQLNQEFFIKAQIARIAIAHLLNETTCCDEKQAHD